MWRRDSIREIMPDISASLLRCLFSVSLLCVFRFAVFVFCLLACLLDCLLRLLVCLVVSLFCSCLVLLASVICPLSTLLLLDFLEGGCKGQSAFLLTFQGVGRYVQFLLLF